jgi:hypothetical protein
MSEIDREKYQRATAIFKLGVKASNAAVHRTLNRTPKGKGWVPCFNAPAGVMCRPEKVRESIAHFKAAYDIYPDIVALNQIALSYEMLSEVDAARDYFTRMRQQALEQNNSAYVQAADFGLRRLR